MKRLSILVLAIFCAAGVAGAQSPSPAAPASPGQASTEQTLAKQVGSDCYNRRRLAIRAVNLKYIALTQDAAAQFAKENNTARTDDANVWIKNLAWANDANLKGVAPDTKDRLGALQAAYLKERVDAIVTADNASVDQVEGAIKTASPADAEELGKQEERIKQELRSIAKANGTAPPQTVAVTHPAASADTAPAPKPGELLTAGQQMAADFGKARAEAVKIVNHKYAELSAQAMDLFRGEGNEERADAAKDWTRRLGWTDDVGNLQAAVSTADDRLGALQKAYLKERADAMAAVDKAWLDKVKAAREKASPDTDMKGAVALTQTMDVMSKELGITPPPRPPSVSQAIASQPAANSPNAGPSPATQTSAAGDASHPFGVERPPAP